MFARKSYNMAAQCFAKAGDERRHARALAELKMAGVVESSRAPNPQAVSARDAATTTEQRNTTLREAADLFLKSSPPDGADTNQWLFKAALCCDRAGGNGIHLLVAWIE